MFHYSSNFTVANLTIAFNFDWIYARNGSFQIIGNEVYGNTRSGIDIRAGSTNFAMGGNHVHDNGYEGMICTECSRVRIDGNTVEHNEEAGKKLFPAPTLLPSMEMLSAITKNMASTSGTTD